MKPRNKKEQRLVELQSKFHPLYKRDYNWVCNHYEDLKKNGNVMEYFGIAEVCEEFQVLRWIINKRNGRKAMGVEVMQMWIDRDHVYYFAKSRQCLGNYYVDCWCLDTPIVFRGHYDDYTYLSRDLRICDFMNVKIHALIPQFKYNGIDENYLVYHNPYQSLRYLANPHYATMASESKEIATFCRSNWKQVENIFTAFKICKRNHYKFTDANLWCDYILLLIKNKLDIHNAHYVCPEDIEHAHTWALGIEEARLERCNKEAIARANEAFLKHHVNFLNIVMTNDNLFIHSLDSVAAYISEGHIMQHCVGHLGKYYLKPNSLILTCACDGKKIATIEVNINDERIVQIRGYKNCQPPHYEEIIQLVTDNLYIVAERKAEKNKKQTKIA